MAASSQQREHGVASAGTTRSRARSRSASSSMPSTALDAMTRAQLLLRFPPSADQMDGWRATFQSLIGFAEAEGSQRPGLPRRPQATTMARAADHVEGGTPTMQSPPQQPAQRLQTEPRDQEPDEASMASSHPWARRDQRLVLEDRRREDARVTIERHHETRRQSNRCSGPDINEHV